MLMSVWITLAWRQMCVPTDSVKTRWRITSVFATQATAAMLLKSYATVRDKLYTLGCHQREFNTWAVFNLKTDSRVTDRQRKSLILDRGMHRQTDRRANKERLKGWQDGTLTHWEADRLTFTLALYSGYIPHRQSTTVSSETYPFIHLTDW